MKPELVKNDKVISNNINYKNVGVILAFRKIPDTPRPLLVIAARKQVHDNVRFPYTLTYDNWTGFRQVVEFKIGPSLNQLYREYMWNIPLISSDDESMHLSDMHMRVSVAERKWSKYIHHPRTRTCCVHCHCHAIGSGRTDKVISDHHRWAQRKLDRHANHFLVLVPS